MELTSRPQKDEYIVIPDEDSEGVEEVEGTSSNFENYWKSMVGFIVFFVAFIAISSQLVMVESDIDRDEVLVYQTSQNGRVFEQSTVNFDSHNSGGARSHHSRSRGTSDPAVMYIDANMRFQEIIGFGGAFTEASALNYFKLPLHWRMQVLEAYFGEEGAHFNLGRVAINSCDFSTSTYSFDDSADDFKLQHFDHHVGRDKQNIIPFIQQAKRTARGDIALLASPWSPPAWMKVPAAQKPLQQQQQLEATVDGASAPVMAQSMMGSATPNGLIDTPEVKMAWAQYISKFISAYKLHGLHVWAVTPQNEPEFPAPWEACVYNSSFQRHFVEEFLGPVLRRDHVLPDGDHIKILAYDHNKEHLEAWTAEMFGQGDTSTGTADGGRRQLQSHRAASYVDGMAFHWYSSTEALPIRLLDGTFGYDAVNNAHHMMQSSSKSKDRKGGGGGILLPTEGCSCSGVRLGDWVRAERLGHDVLFDLANHAQGYVMWNLLVDAQGGPNHLQNYCDAPIVVVPDAESDYARSGHVGPVIFRAFVQPSLHYIKHFSHFLPPGSVRVQASIVGSFRYQLDMDPMMSAGVEVGLFPCERSVRQLWVLHADSGALELRVPSLLDPSVVVPPEGVAHCDYDSSRHSSNYSESKCQRERLCVFGSGANPNDKFARWFLKLGDCQYPPPDAPRFRFSPTSSQLRDERSGKCVESVINMQDAGFLLRLSDCDGENSVRGNQKFHLNETTGELGQHLGTLTGRSHLPDHSKYMCLTAGWPFVSSVAFLDTRAAKQTVAIVINEANTGQKLRVYSNHSESQSTPASDDGDGAEPPTSRTLRSAKTRRATAMSRAFEVNIEPRSITTMLYLD